MITTFIIKYWKTIILAIVCVAVGFSIAWWIQGIRVDRADAQLQKEKAEAMILSNNLKICQDANISNNNTITALKAEVRDATNLCASRLKAKDTVINRLMDIQNLKQEVRDEKGNIVSDDDAILRELNGMYINANSNNKN